MDINTQAQAIPVQQLNAPNLTAAQKAGKDFEAMFLHQMLEHMSQGVKTPENFGGGSAEGIFRSMMNEKIAQTVADSGGIGVAAAIENQIKIYQEAQNK